MDKTISLDYGSGGKKTAALIEEMILPRFGNGALNALGDGAVLPGAEKLVFSADSFVVQPLFFPGGNIGKLSVCGTVNDLAMAGGKPLFLSLSLIIEEGFETEKLAAVLDSAARTAKEAGVQIVTGDTKVVERGGVSGLMINTAGIGRAVLPSLSPDAIQPGDKIILSGTLGDHGAAVMLARNPGLFEADICSDCCPLARAAGALFSLGEALRVLRDPTRGGVATTLNEFAENRASGLALHEKDLPVSPTVQAACDLLGLDPLYSANEGKLLAVVAPEKAEEALQILRGFPETAGAVLIGEAVADHPGRVVLHTAFGGTRVLQKLSGAQLPRIC